MTRPSTQPSWRHSRPNRHSSAPTSTRPRPRLDPSPPTRRRSHSPRPNWARRVNGSSATGATGCTPRPARRPRCAPSWRRCSTRSSARRRTTAGSNPRWSRWSRSRHAWPRSVTASGENATRPRRRASRWQPPWCAPTPSSRRSRSRWRRPSAPTWTPPRSTIAGPPGPRRSHLALDEARQRAGADHLSDLDGVVGTLLDVVDVDPGWEAAFEAAVADALGAVVVDSPTVARQCARLSVVGRAGRLGAGARRRVALDATAAHRRAGPTARDVDPTRRRRVARSDAGLRSVRGRVVGPRARRGHRAPGCGRGDPRGRPVRCLRMAPRSGFLWRHRRRARRGAREGRGRGASPPRDRARREPGARRRRGGPSCRGRRHRATGIGSRSDSAP